MLLSVLAVFFKRSALELAVYGFIYVALLAAWAFQTPWAVVWLAAADGFLTTLPLLAVVFLGILFSQLLVATGSLERLVVWLLSGLDRPISRHLLITLGLGNFFEGASIIAEPMVAPMLHTAGVKPAGAAALSIIGYCRSDEHRDGRHYHHGPGPGNRPALLRSGSSGGLAVSAGHAPDGFVHSVFLA